MGHEVVASNRGQLRRDKAKQKFNILVYRDINEMLRLNTVDAVVICSPNSFHKEHLAIAIEKGLNVFVEKPLAVVLDGLDELKIKAAEQGLITHVAANMRFHFGPNKVKEYLDIGFLGRPLWARFWGGMHLPDWHPNENYRDMYSASKRLGGGAVMDFIHEIDLILWMFGDPDKLAAITGRTGFLEIETEDIADVIMSYKNRLQISLHIDYLQRPFQRGIHIVGDKGWVKWDLAEQKVEAFEHHSQKLHVINYPSEYTQNDMYLAQMEYFISCIEYNTCSESDISAGKKALNLALNIKKSASSSQFF